MSVRPRKTKALDASAESCPLTSSPELRLSVDQQTDSIKANFPNGLARPALRALFVAGFRSLEQLTQASEAELAGLHGMGPKGVGLLRAALNSKGLDFRS